MNELMRRKDRRIGDDEALEILHRGEYGILSMCSTSGEGYGIPVNYALWNNCIYIHCALEGSKLDNIKNNNRVSFCVTGSTKVLPSEFGTLYESCIVSGIASLADEGEKRDALRRLVEKYSPDFTGEGEGYIDKYFNKTVIIKIFISSISGKARRK